MREYKSDNGTIKYRVPNPIECLQLYGLMGLNSQKMQDSQELTDNDLLYLSRMAENMGKYIEKVELEYDDLSVKSYKEMIKHAECLADITGMASQLMIDMSAGGEAKKP